ncbi:hypothetical protein [Isoptericola halotolerans]|uniref:GGDEF domain-containing protein n=1 Tax=Isoptericola halotolerans TaxID=300560 RepID=A0ABX2A549_9MICO|nr:hypothetical protein [Isoptericola halotolerans]NOV97040.1 GGDEF domain-containing protein [Isoptericola halotolerans]
MSIPTSGAPAADTRERWRTASLTEVWLRPGDWYHPAVDALVEALVAGRSPEMASHRLGTARSAAGIGLDETLDDLACLYRSLGEPLDVDAVRGAAQGWVQVRERDPAPTGVRDPATGLPTADYLGERLRETYGRATDDEGVPGTHCLVVLDVAVDSLGAWQRMARAASVGNTLDQVFGPGHPMAALSDGVFAVLCERGTETTRLAQSVRIIVERNAEVLGVSESLRRPVRVWVERLPETHESALDLIKHLRR